ncbi:hypothetical protein AA0481_0097 [Acetobacter orientalis NRIC 0481]|nr:hypothetical protein AA0481_0097 [Acetobacter orientalis NRIC 0481]
MLVLWGGRGGLRIVTPTRRGLLLRALLATAKQPTQKTTARLLLLLRLLRSLLGLLQLELQLLDTVLRFYQSGFLHNGHLRNAVAGFGVLLKLLGNKLVCLRVYRGQAGAGARHAAKTALLGTAYACDKL